MHTFRTTTRAHTAAQAEKKAREEAFDYFQDTPYRLVSAHGRPYQLHDIRSLDPETVYVETDWEFEAGEDVRAANLRVFREHAADPLGAQP